MSLAQAAAGLILAGLVAYALLGGADFGGGVWDLLARGPRREAQRRLVERALAPVWEANHVWLIFVIVVMFSAFPAAYAAISTGLHVPLVVMLLGIVLRGSAFTFRHYDTEGPDAAVVQRRWGRVFAVTSTITPVALGVCAGAVTQGRMPAPGGIYRGGFVEPWLGALPIAVGLLALALFAFLAAVYLCVEAAASGDAALADDFRRRALAAAGFVAIAALGAALAPIGSDREAMGAFADRLLGSWWSWPLQVVTGLAALTAIGGLWRRHWRIARIAAAAQVALIVVGWGLAQQPVLVAPDLTIENTAAPEATLRLVLIAIGGGALLLVPSLYWLFRVFKREAAFAEMDEQHRG